MIERVSELPFWGPEEQIRRFINQHDDPTLLWDMSLRCLGVETSPDATANVKESQWEEAFQALADEKRWNEETKAEKRREYLMTQRTLTQLRIENLDDIFQKQLIWSYGKQGIDDAYFYWDWCPTGTGVEDDTKWRVVAWEEFPYNLARDIDRSFKFTEFKGVTNTTTRDQMPQEYDSSMDAHALDETDVDNPTTLDVDTLYHNIMRSYIEVSEWLGDGAVQYGSRNGYVSRKMSLAWLFDSIKALINWKLANQEKWAEVDIQPFSEKERFLANGAESSCHVIYNDANDLGQTNGRCALQRKQRAQHPDVNGVQIVRGNEFHYGERADFYTHNSFIGECRFFHNARFLGQTTFDKEINGTALRARWADVCENYSSDNKYEPGTLVKFGGSCEITLADSHVNGIITTKPGLILNGDSSSGTIMLGVALSGRVPVNVVGHVKKFDRLVPSWKYRGYARARRWYEFFRKPIGIALCDSLCGQVECVTMLHI